MNLDRINWDAALSHADAAAGNGSHRAPSFPNDWWKSPEDVDCGPDSAPFYPVDDVRTWSADDVRARAERLVGIREHQPDDYQRIADCLDKRGIFSREQLDSLVEAKRA